MATTIVLILCVVSGGGRPACVTQEFESAEACQKAGVAFGKAWESKIWFVCAPKR